MAYTLTLSDGTTSLDLVGSTYALLPQGLSMPTPRLRQAWAGSSLLRHGADLVDQVYDNREVTLELKVVGASMDGLRTALQDLAGLVERASEYAAHGLGAQVTLTYQWNGAASSTIFDVLSGRVSFPDVGWRKPALDAFTVWPVTVSLVCKPFARGAQESIENYVADPSFEVAGTALADWTDSVTATGSGARSTAQAKYGSASLLLTMTNSGASGQVVERTQVLTDVDAAEVWSFSAWVYVTALSNAKAVLVALYNDGGATTSTVERTTVSSGWVKLSLANETVPAGATQVTLKVRLESTDAGATGTAYVDGVLAVQAASLPAAWASGRSLANHFDDNGQAHVNYMDLLDVPGDVPAAVKVYVDEQQAGTTLRAGVRHAGEYDDAGLYHEGESFAGGSWTSAADAASSGGNYGRWPNPPAMSINAASPTVVTKTVTTPPEGMYRVLARAKFQTAQFGLAMGYAYGGVTDDPSVAADYTTVGAAASFTLYDLGTLSVPPFAVPEGETKPSITLRLCFYDILASGANEAHIDWVLLLPINRGSVYGSKTSAQDKWLSDGISSRPGLWVLDRSNDTVKSLPTWLGGPPGAHPKGTRLYVVQTQSSDVAPIANAVAVKVTYEPRFLVVR